MIEKYIDHHLIQRQSFFWSPDFLDISAWIEHIPFAYWIMEVHQPKILVELGVHNGVSYFSFCQAAERLNSDTLCYAVDTWMGDEHSGFYGEDIFTKVTNYNNQKFSRFSTLIRSSFAEARNYFLDSSVDLLHIDGLHTYEAVKEDFENWLPKLSPNAIVVFHDINVRERSFGVFKYWEELKQRYQHFQFDFGNGLGIISINSQLTTDLSLIISDKSGGYYTFLRNLFSERGMFFKQMFENKAIVDRLLEKIQSQADFLNQGTDREENVKISYNQSLESYLNLSSVLDEEKKDYNELKEKTNDLSSHNINLKLRNEDLNKRFEELILHSTAIENQNQKLTNVLENLIDNCGILTTNLKETTQLHEIMKKSNEELRKNLEQSQVENLIFREKDKESAIINRNLVEKNTQLALNYNELQNANNILKDNIVMLQKKYDELEIRYNAQEKSYKELHENLQADLFIVEEEKELLRNRVAELLNKSQSLEVSFKHIESELEQHGRSEENLVLLLQQHKQQITWYKATFEDRSLPGILKEKLFRLLKRKAASVSKNNFTEPVLKENKKELNELLPLKLPSVPFKNEKDFYHLQPINEIITLNEPDVFTSTGTDPYFLVDLTDSKLKSGWYWFSANIKEVDGMLLTPKLYFNHGGGFNEEDIWNLPYISNGTIACLIHLPHDIVAMRFDPTTTKCTFQINSISLTPKHKIEVLQIGIDRYKKIYLNNKGVLSLCKDLTANFYTNGFSETKDKIKSAIYCTEINTSDQYRKWYTLYDTLTPDKLTAIKILSDDLSKKPLFSIIMPVYNAPLPFLKKAIDSVMAQVYTNWELCIADDNSTHRSVKKLLATYQKFDKRIKIIYRKTNGHISKASNSALELATGEFAVLMDQDDELLPHSLYMVASALNIKSDLSLIYSDEDKIDEYGNRFDPYFKTDWNQELFYGQNFINHLGVYKLSLVRQVGGFRPGFEGSQDYDLALRCIEQMREDQIFHIPHILYHWRAIKGSTAITLSNKGYATGAGLRALQEHLVRTGQKAKAEMHVNGSYRIKIDLAKQSPLVSIVITSKDRVDVLENCVRSIMDKTDYPKFEILIIDNNSEEADTLSFLEKIQNEFKNVKVFPFNSEFNFSALNNFGAQKAAGEVLVLLNNDTAVLSGNWLQEMVSLCLKKEVGAVGAKLFYPNGQIQHAGVFLTEGQPGNHIYLKRDKNDPGYFNKLNLVQNYIAVTAACLAVRKEVYLEAGGLDEKNLKVAYNDVDFCLKLFVLGYKNVWTPFAQLTHYESLSRGSDFDEINFERFKKEHSFILKKWDSIMSKDPFFNHNLATDTRTTQFSFPPKIRYEWDRQQEASFV